MEEDEEKKSIAAAKCVTSLPCEVYVVTRIENDEKLFKAMETIKTDPTMTSLGSWIVLRTAWKNIDSPDRVTEVVRRQKLVRPTLHFSPVEAFQHEGDEDLPNLTFRSFRLPDATSKRPAGSSVRFAHARKMKLSEAVDRARSGALVLQERYLTHEYTKSGVPNIVFSVQTSVVEVGSFEGFVSLYGGWKILESSGVVHRIVASSEHPSWTSESAQRPFEETCKMVCAKLNNSES